MQAMTDIGAINPNLAVGSAAGACMRLGQSFSQNATFTPQNDLYTDMVHASWSSTTWLEPACIFVPRTVDELQAGVPILAQEGATFGVRSGGHMPVAGAAMADHGVLIDMSRFANIDYDKEKNQVVVGTGLRWKDVYGYLDPYEVTVVGGRVLDVGVGGLILGCGLSYLSESYGLACDNVVNFQVVLADGSTVDANESSHSDLFWALKGGSNNFGIVTSFTLKTYPVHNVWGGTRLIKWDQVDDFLDTMLEYDASPERDPLASVNINLPATNSTTLGIVLTLVYLKPVEKPAVFSLFDKFETLMDTTGIKTLTQVMSEFPTPAIPRIRFHAMTVKPSKELTDVIKNVMRNSPHMETIRSVTAGTCSFSWQPISSHLVTAGQQQCGGNAIGLEAVAQSWFHIDLLWWNAADDEAMRAAGAAMMAEIETAARAHGSHMRYIFMNDANEAEPVIAGYGADNVQRMRKVQAKYDPDHVFEKLLARAFKLPAA
ncbi:FAD-binding oxidoreductase [Apiospora kogelbergensis]|uniref:FAD-binding oxidoreductase n=1 Tax=Apiospora kogelbergensis TaxID=1337665 RepID=A0AAW0QBY4_9PEZI